MHIFYATLMDKLDQLNISGYQLQLAQQENS